MQSSKTNTDTKKLWFRNKSYGWGWTPAAKEGWLVVCAFIVIYIFSVLLYGFLMSDLHANVFIYSTVYMIWILALTTILLVIAFKKGEKPEWRWGGKSRKHHTDKP